MKSKTTMNKNFIVLVPPEHLTYNERQYNKYIVPATAYSSNKHTMKSFTRECYTFDQSGLYLKRTSDNTMIPFDGRNPTAHISDRSSSLKIIAFRINQLL